MTRSALFKCIGLLMFGWSSICLSSQRQNDYPIVFVHGFLGWGDHEMGPLKYWGGFDEDPKADLRKIGFETLSVAVGPVSSNWDRAVEAFYSLKGGRVDYGAAHAKKHGHSRWGRYFPGTYRQWGSEGDDGTKKLHFIAHSQGVQTVRQLIQLLAVGDDEEIIYAEEHGLSLSPLFSGNKEHWVSSLVSLAGVMDGTTFSPAIENYIPEVAKFVGAIEVMLKKTGLSKYLYDLKLDQWDLLPKKGEALKDYFKRFLNHPAMTSTDNSLYDLSPRGAADLNARAPNREKLYYFSFGTSATVWSDPSRRNRQRPQKFVSAIFRPFANLLGSCTSACEREVPIDSSWLENDAVVNTRSTMSPTLKSYDERVEFDEELGPIPGVWNYMGTLRSFDHMQVVGFGNGEDSPVLPLYTKIANMLGSLPR